jgi:hypothetical protein
MYTKEEGHVYYLYSNYNFCVIIAIQVVKLLGYHLQNEEPPRVLVNDGAKSSPCYPTKAQVLLSKIYERSSV